MAESAFRGAGDRMAGLRPTLVALWAFFATIVAIAGFRLLEPALAASSAAAVLPLLVLVGAVAGLARLGAAGWVVTLAGAGAAVGVRAAVGWYLADVYQGNTVVTERSGYLAFLILAQLGGIAALAAGYWVVAAFRRSPTGSVRIGLAGTVVAIVGGVGLAAATASSPVVLDPASEPSAVHRVTITESAITLDAATMSAGKVTWLATVRGNPPRDLALVSVERRSISGIETPPSGSTDFLIERGTLAPGHYYFTAGFAGSWPPPPDASGGLPPMQRGSLVAEFEVVP